MASWFVEKLVTINKLGMHSNAAVLMQVNDNRLRAAGNAITFDRFVRHVRHCAQSLGNNSDSPTSSYLAQFELPSFPTNVTSSN